MSKTINLASHGLLSLDSKREISKDESLIGYSRSEYIQKRIIDYVLVIFLTIVSLPVMLYTIYRIKKESFGPIFFKQTRIGLNGKSFECYKFRSMHVNSNFNPYTEENDSRIFPFGIIMRKMRIDELPQMLNVLKGDMHLIGPRAEWDILVEEYTDAIPHYQNRHIVKPGITGLAQVLYPYGRNVNDAKNKLKYDLIYIKKWSFLVELKVIIKTVWIILSRKGI
jgi:lipopolysaccharide/colanic/teichoic acid biosynthesis glycosyltransferase